jgi:hypothetical protein
VPAIARLTEIRIYEFSVPLLLLFSLSSTNLLHAFNFQKGGLFRFLTLYIGFVPYIQVSFPNSRMCYSFSHMNLTKGTG